MGFSAKSKNKSSSNSSENWGMGFLLVFFPADDDNNNSNPIVDKTNKLFSSSSQSSSSSLKPNSIRRSNSNRLLTRAQSTISICALLVFITLLLFTLSTFEPTLPTTKTQLITSRRYLSEKSATIYTNKTKTNHNSFFSSSWFTKFFKNNAKNNTKNATTSSIALQGMGTLYRRGTRAMNDLVVAHVQEDVSEAELRLFLRLLHRSVLTAKADIVFIFSSQASSSTFRSLIQEESDSFLKLVRHYTKQLKNSTSREPSFDVTQFLKFGKKEKEMGEPLWGKRIRSNYSNPDGREGETELTRLSYSSMASFEATELDPENSLAGFLDHVPMSLRRWACYPMLLGRVRRNFKHVMLLDVKNLLVLGDPLGRVRNRSPESVHLFTKSDTTSGKHSKKNSDKSHSHSPVNSAIIMGGTRGVRRLSTAMLTEIVRASMQHKRKNPVSDSGLLNQLVDNEFVLKNINLITSTEPVLDASSLIGLKSNTGLSDYTVIQHSNTNSHEVHSVIMSQICSFEVDSSVYRDC